MNANHMVTICIIVVILAIAVVLGTGWDGHNKRQSLLLSEGYIEQEYCYSIGKKWVKP